MEDISNNSHDIPESPSGKKAELKRFFNTNSKPLLIFAFLLLNVSVVLGVTILNSNPTPKNATVKAETTIVDDDKAPEPNDISSSLTTRDASSQGTIVGNNHIGAENKNPGSNAWRIKREELANDMSNQIKGYASKTSVNAGEAIEFKVSVNPSQRFSLEVYRLGYYQGLGGRLVVPSVSINGIKQPDCPTNSTTGLTECKWSTSYSLQVPTNWTTGVYVVKLTNANNLKNYITFVVRNDSRQADVLFQQNVNTYQAYNNWPSDMKENPPGTRGKSLYPYNSSGPKTIKGSPDAVKVSFDRPYSDNGAGQFFQYEVFMMRWLEKNGYSVNYSTDVDTHANGAHLTKYKAFVIAGHGEYWSRNMYNAAEAARDAGVNLGFFAANSVYWQVRYEPSSTGSPNRTMVCYRGSHGRDPIQGSNNTQRFRDSDINRAEQKLLGVQLPQRGLFADDPFKVTTDTHWIYSGTGLKNGDTIPGLIGYEYDREDRAFPTPIKTGGAIIAKSPLLDADGKPDFAHTSIYQAPSRARVFASGTIWWPLFLDGTKEHAAVKQMTSNILRAFGALPLLTSSPTPMPQPTSSASAAPLPNETPAE